MALATGVRVEKRSCWPTANDPASSPAHGSRRLDGHAAAQGSPWGLFTGTELADRPLRHDFDILVHGTGGDTNVLPEDIATVLEPLGRRRSFKHAECKHTLSNLEKHCVAPGVISWWMRSHRWKRCATQPRLHGRRRRKPAARTMPSPGLCRVRGGTVGVVPRQTQPGRRKSEPCPKYGRVTGDPRKPSMQIDRLRLRQRRDVVARAPRTRPFFVCIV